MATKPAQQKTCEGVLQTKEKNKTSMSPQEKIKTTLKYQPKEEKNTKFHKNQPNDRNQYTISINWILAVLFLPIKRQTSRLDQKSGDNPGLER